MILNFLFASAFNSAIDETPVVFFLLLHVQRMGRSEMPKRGKCDSHKQGRVRSAKLRIFGRDSGT